MPSDDDASHRVKELIAGIEIEKDPKRFSALIEELNHLLDIKEIISKPPKPAAQRANALSPALPRVV